MANPIFTPKDCDGKSSPVFLAILCEGFLSRLSFGLIAFALPLYARRLGLDIAQIGVLVSLNLGMSMLLKPFMGCIADRVGYKRGASLAVALRSLLVLLFAAAGSPWHLYALQSARGLAKSIRDPSMYALIAEHGSKKSLASAFAWYQTAKYAAGAIGKASAGVLLTLTGSNFSWVFGLAFAISVLPLLALGLFLPKDTGLKERAAPKPKISQKHGEESESLGWDRLLPFMGFGFLVSGTARMLRGLFPILAIEYAGLNEAQTGVLYLISAFAAIVSGPIFGWLYDHASRKLVLMARSFANVVSSAIYVLSPTFIGFTIARSFDNAGKAAFSPAWGALMGEVSSEDRRRRARLIGLMSTGRDAGSVSGSILGGFIWSIWGVAGLMGTRIILAIVSEIYMLILHRKIS